MVKYDNKNWFQFLFRPDSLAYNFPGMLWGMITIGIATAIIIVLDLQVLHISVPPMLHTVLGLVIGLMLVFRTNTAYDRWWEGRRQLGQLVNTSRNMATKFNSYLGGSGYEHMVEIKELVAGFSWTLKEHLREQDYSEASKHIPAHLLEGFMQSDHKPNYVIMVISKHIKASFDRGIINGEQLIVLEHETTTFANVLGACERIRNTPIPMGYALHLKRILLIYLISLPFTFVQPFTESGDSWLPYMAIPLIMLVFYTMIGIELLGEEIEDPFGNDPNDLPVDELAEKIKKNVFEIMEYDMTTVSTNSAPAFSEQ